MQGDWQLIQCLDPSWKMAPYLGRLRSAVGHSLGWGVEMNEHPVVCPSYTTVCGCSMCFLEPSQAEVDLGSINGHKMSS